MALFFAPSTISAQGFYFQQEVNYKMSVRLNDVDRTLSGFTEIQYKNNSPQTLEYIYFHLWPNAYKNNSTALAKQLLKEGKLDLHFAKNQDRGFIDSLDFKVDGVNISWDYDPEHIDICKLKLNKPLKSGESITISTPFFVKIPDARFSRLGYTNQAFFITQWYPKPAVFDAEGWHAMPYLDQGEFYSEFGSFDVSITLPENYLLAATGDREENEKEEKFLNSKVLETKKFLSTNTRNDFGMKFPKSSESFKTVRFKQTNVHDFAWFADKRFYVLKDQFQLPHSKRSVDSWVFFTDKNFELWSKANAYVNDATIFYSQLNGDYPYKHVTAIDGTIMAGGGMEYPNITVIGDAGSDFELDMVITHEVGHNWFYGILGSNERDHPMLDEGINSFFEMRYVRAKYPDNKLTTFIGKDSTFKLFGLNTYPLWKYHELSFFTALRAHTDQPLNLKSLQYTSNNYGSIVYSKSAIIFDYLLDYLGEEVFDRAMKAYFEKFKFKHPNPNDLLTVLKDESGKDLSWFEDKMIKRVSSIDYKIKGISKREDGSYDIKIKNKGQVVAPYSIFASKQGKALGIMWFQGFQKNTIVNFPATDVDRFTIDRFKRMPEINRKNNTSRTTGIFKKSRPIQFNFLTKVEDPTKNQIGFLPIAGGNFYDGFLLGLSVYNYNLYPKPFEYMIAPMYGFKTGSLGGFAEFNYNFYRVGIFQQITAGVKAKKFSYDYFDVSALNESTGTNYSNVYFQFLKISPYIKFDFRKKDPTSNINRFLIYTNNNLFTDSLNSSSLNSATNSAPAKKQTMSVVNQLSYVVNNVRAFDPYSYNLSLQHTASMAKVSGTLNYKFTLSKKNSIECRVFVGAFMAGSAEERGNYAFRAAGYSGWHDYLFDGNYMARNERNGVGFSQFMETDGAMKVWTPLGQSAEWLSAINVKSPKIFGTPLKIYGDFMVCDGRALLDEKYLWDFGINISLWSNMIEIYLPLLYSNDIKNTLELNNIDWNNRIRFTFNIHKLEPKKTLQSSLF